MERIEFRTGKKVFLRGLTEEDVNATYMAWLNDKEVTQGLYTGLFPVSLDDIRGYVNANTAGNGAVLFAICLVENGMHIGNIRLGGIDWVSRIAEVGLFIGNKDYWGGGYGSEAVNLVLNYAHQDLNLQKVWLTVFSNNERAIGAYEKQGFTVEGTQQRQVFRNGEWLDKIYMAKFLGE